MLIFLSMLETDAEREEFSRLYHRYGNAMLRVAQRYFSSDLSMAEDAVQNAWLKVVRNFSKIQEISCKKQGAYLVVIVKNESISILRKHRKEVPFDETLVCEDAEHGDAESIIVLIRNLPETYRAVLDLRFVEERTPQEIAQQLGLTESTVYTRIHRGRALLMEKLREEDYIV
ncbi:sigma-70 family RNA polymerase sigma factor [Bengtsoniella intestinalis]|uniref:RNA polymerase sigma factor n=1 Tax=Bengtsoniella intestinalis TaxID=3073143 RepID=UPI00391F4487